MMSKASNYYRGAGLSNELSHGSIATSDFSRATRCLLDPANQLVLYDRATSPDSVSGDHYHPTDFADTPMTGFLRFQPSIDRPGLPVEVMN